MPFVRSSGAEIENDGVLGSGGFGAGGKRRRGVAKEACGREAQDESAGGHQLARAPVGMSYQPISSSANPQRG